MGKKRKHEQNKMTSMPRDEIPLEGTSDAFPSSTPDILIQLKDIVQVKVNTDERLQKLEETVKRLEQTVEKLEKKVKRLKKNMKKNKIKESEKKEQLKEVKEDLKRELMENIEEKIENKSKEYFQKHLEEVKEEPYIEIQEEMDKERSDKVNRCSASPSLRLQPHQSQTSFHLRFECEMDAIIYKGKPMLTIEVVLYDGDNPIAPDHHIASAVVELVVIDGEFSGQIQGYWSKDEFIKSIMKSRQGNNSQGEPPKVPVKNGRFKLYGGRCCHKGAVIMENSNRKDVKLGVMITGDTKDRVLEGISNSFRVQEAKTAEKRGKRIADETPEDLPRYIGHKSLHVRHKKGQGQQNSFPSAQQNFTIMPNQLQIIHAQTVGNGPGSELLVVHQQQNTIQQADHGHGSVGPLPLEPSQYPVHPDTTQLESYGSSTQMCTSHCADYPWSKGDQPDNPREFEYSEPPRHAVAASPGTHSAGTQHWGICQLPRSHPQTEDEYQDDGSFLCAPRTLVPAPERTQMDFTQAMTPGSQTPWPEVHLLEPTTPDAIFSNSYRNYQEP